MVNSFESEVKKETSNIPPGIYQIVSKKGISSYRVRIRIKGHPPMSKNFKTLTHAKKWKRVTEGLIEKGDFLSYLEQNNHTFSEAIERYLKEVPTQKKRIQDVKQHLDRWIQELGNPRLSKITPSQIAAIRDQLLRETTVRKKTRSPASVVRYLATLSHLFSIAVREWEWVKENPVSRVRKPKESPGRIRYLSKEETQSLLVQCAKSENPYLLTIVSIALQTGMRRGEILGLQWKDIDFPNQWAHLHDTKNGALRIVPLSNELVSLLKKHENKKGTTSLIFPSPNDNTKPIDFRSAWKAVLRRANISNFLFHDLRHTAASYLAMAGFGYGQIGEVLGHKSSQMTKRYAHLSFEAKQGMAQVLQQLFTIQKEGHTPISIR